LTVTEAASISLPSILAVVVVAAGCIAAAVGIYLLVLSVAALLYSDRRRPTSPNSRVAVVIPAHNEAALIADCVRALRAQRYPSDLYRVFVVADNCSDDTARIAAAAGAHEVMVRDEPHARGKGYALRWAMDRLLVDEPAARAFVFIDADSIAEPDFLGSIVQPFDAGAQAVQGEYLLAGDGSVQTALGVMAFSLTNRVRPAGRAALHLSATHLAGNGMLLSRDLLLKEPWEAFTSAEDLEYSLMLHMAGVKIAFAGGAVLRSLPAPSRKAASQQKLRWEGGKVHLARLWIPRLIGRALRDVRPSLLGAAFELALPPLALLAAAVCLGALVAAVLVIAGILSAWTVIPSLLALVSIPLHVLIGLRAARVPGLRYVALAGAPALIIVKALRARRLLSFRGDTWVRTERPER
jgi:hypothetical protein